MSASDDVIATLSSRVSELSKRVAMLEAELESAQKRIAIYEEHDATIQDALSGALKAAYTIRERSETTAAQILDQAREERRVLLKEIERLRDERDALQNDIADQRRSGIQAVAPRPLTSDIAASELRAVASEALRGLFQEIVDDMRSAPRAEPAPARAEPAAPREPVAPPAAAAPVPPATVERAPEPPQHEAAPPAPTEQPTYEYMSKIRRLGATEVEAAPPVPASQPAAAAPATPAEDVEIGTAGPDEDVEIARAEPAEDVEVAPAAPAAAQVAEPAPAAPPEPVSEPARARPLELVSSREAEDIAPPRVETTGPTTDIQLVLSPIASFPRLVEIERHIQSLPAVRTLYVRDFRAGVATLAVALRSPMAPDEFAGILASLSEPRMRVVSSARNSLELRIDGAASIA